MTIKIQLNNSACKINAIKKGDWIDLRAAEDVDFKCPEITNKYVMREGKLHKVKTVKFDTKLIPLGVAMELPKGYEALINSRSGIPFKLGILILNGQGVIDNSYNGNQDEWKYPAYAIEETKVLKGDRICQFKVQLSQKATIWQKIKWLFSSGIKFKEVNILRNKNRGGFNSTGIQ